MREVRMKILVCEKGIPNKHINAPAIVKVKLLPERKGEEKIYVIMRKCYHLNHLVVPKLTHFNQGKY